MARRIDLVLTALAPAIWGSSYIVLTQALPDWPPLLVAMLRALPAGLLLLLIVRRLPPRDWILRVFILGALNFSLLWALLFFSAYRLPGGVAATLGALQPLLVIFLSALALQTRISRVAILAALLGLAGVALLVLTPEAQLDPIGILAGLGGAASMATGVVLTRKWQPPVPPLTFTAWQMTAGGLLLVPLALWSTSDWPDLTAANLGGLAYLGLIGGAATYVLWFRGIARIEPEMVAILGVFSPLSAVALGWVLMGETLTAVQLAGAVIVLFSVWLRQSNLRLGLRPSPASDGGAS